MKYTPLFLIVFFFGCANDADLLDDAVYIQEVVEVEVREPKGGEGTPESEVSILSRKLIEIDQELASLFCHGDQKTINFGQGSYLVFETSMNNFERLSFNELQNYGNRAMENLDNNGLDRPIIYRNYLMDGLVSLDNTSDFITNLFADFNVIRQTGLKTIVRFSYTMSPSNENSAKPFEYVLEKGALEHIIGLSSTLKNNADVISCFQIVFVGD